MARWNDKDQSNIQVLVHDHANRENNFSLYVEAFVMYGIPLAIMYDCSH